MIFFLLVAFPLSALSYRGTECHPRSTLPASHVCQFNSESLCKAYASCVLWKTGTFETTAKRSVPSAQAVPYVAVARSWAKDPSKGFFLDGRYQNSEFGMNVIAWLGDAEARRTLRGHHIAMYGDSIMRQLYLRMVFHLRGFDDVVEQYFHADSYYVFNETHDELLIAATERTGLMYTKETYKAGVAAPWAVIQFFFDTLLKREPIPAATLHIPAIMYWTGIGVHTDADVVRRYEKFAAVRTLFVTTPEPWLLQRPSYAHRNAWVAVRESHPNGTTYLPYAEMSDRRVFHRNTVLWKREHNDLHFMCGFKTHFYRQIEANATFKSPASGDCSGNNSNASIFFPGDSPAAPADTIGLNLAMMTLHHLRTM